MLPSPIQKLADLFATFPGVGPRQAARFVFHLLNAPAEFRKLLADAVAGISDLLLTCTRCGNIEAKHESAGGICSICANKKRDRAHIAVVESAIDLRAIERTRSYNGLYHVLGGSLTPKRDAGETETRMKKLVSRVREEKPEEIIIATSPTYEGDFTARLLEKELREFRVKITRLARGLAKGVDIEYVDDETLQEALAGRR